MKVLKWTATTILLLVGGTFLYGMAQAFKEHSETGRITVTESEAAGVPQVLREGVTIVPDPVKESKPPEPHPPVGTVLISKFNPKEWQMMERLYGSKEEAMVALLLIQVKTKSLLLADTTAEEKELEYWKQEYHRNHPQKEEVIDVEQDNMMHANITRMFYSSDYLVGANILHQITISVTDRVVTLRGVADPAQQELIVDIANNRKMGARSVVNLMTTPDEVGDNG